MIEACKAGKDIYCQKPLALSIVEGRAMSYAVNKHRVVFQTGSQQRSDHHFRRACELVRTAGSVISRPFAWACRVAAPTWRRPGIGKSPSRCRRVLNTRPGLALRPMLRTRPRCHVNFRWILDYSGGQVTDWGGHHPDCAQWGMGTELTGPIEIRNVKGEFPPDPLWNTATEFYFEAVYENGVTMIVSNRNRMGVTFEGTKGKVYVNRGEHTADPKSILDSKIGPNEIHLYKSDDHFRNFIDCVISRGPTARRWRSPSGPHHCHLGNIAMRLGRKSLRWDPRTEQILGDDDASKLLGRPYRDPWKLPAV